MRLHVPLLVACFAVAAHAAAQDHSQCPMAAKMRTGDVDRRHDGATGVSHHDVVHHFLQAPDGGSIRLEVTDPSNVQARDRIREHLQVVARAFADGDFALPMLIHDRTPPGVPVMKEKRGAIRYRYEPTDNGGRILISTTDADALAAVHAFLRFQVKDHDTGDPSE